MSSTKRRWVFFFPCSLSNLTLSTETRKWFHIPRVGSSPSHEARLRWEVSSGANAGKWVMHDRQMQFFEDILRHPDTE
ncbi:hypothetical protein CEXT_400341 [Caerostris extrusa]|uniref:Secreted protein n=1 Tax=Caerostris extrusa TaxID=172846 RepID=A0AAV4Q973_CAEEX|nr:hypothetical protein CEXT_400341 [Caerostris extrusa]